MIKAIKLFIACWALIAMHGASAQTAATKPVTTEKTLGMYMHQHWSYKHPYAVRTWTLEDWKGYLDGLHRLGYNYILIWPMLEIMPDPLTPSDEANLAKIAKVIDMAHQDYNMRVSIVFCPNVSPKSEEGRKYTFEDRPFFHTDDRVDPGDPIAFGKLMEWREKLFKPLAQADGLFVIDSDPGGYPHSTNMEFIYILGAHRRMLDRLRPGIEINYWAHFGWESYGNFYATGELVKRGPEEIREAMQLLAKQHYEPWGVANSGFEDNFADPIQMQDKVLAFPYGAIEYEPAFPLTIYGGDRASGGGRRGGKRGVLGNAQSHVVQLPNTFAFARGAQGKSVEKEDYTAFANELIPGAGKNIVEGWEALQGEDAVRMRKAAKQLTAMPKSALQGGPLKGLMFGDPAGFVRDLALQLNMAASLYELRAVVDGNKNAAAKKKALAGFVDAASAWQGQHGYSNSWHWPQMESTLRKLNLPTINATLDTHTWTSEEGATAFDRVKNGLARMESFTPRLLSAMRKALGEMNGK